MVTSTAAQIGALKAQGAASLDVMIALAQASQSLADAVAPLPDALAAITQTISDLVDRVTELEQQRSTTT